MRPTLRPPWAAWYGGLAPRAGGTDGRTEAARQRQLDARRTIDRRASGVSWKEGKSCSREPILSGLVAATYMRGRQLPTHRGQIATRTLSFGLASKDRVRSLYTWSSLAASTSRQVLCLWQAPLARSPLHVSRSTREPPPTPPPVCPLYVSRGPLPSDRNTAGRPADRTRTNGASQNS